MQCEHLWSVSSSGGVHQLNVKTHQWSCVGLNQPDLAMKRVATSPLSHWAVGGDHRVYVFVPTSDVPVRVSVSTYENQRWNPIQQFSSTLLPTDRPGWSDKDGGEPRPKDSFKLPSRAWQWETDWTIEKSIEGRPLGPEGWSYAVDFPMDYFSDRKWNSLVRRRHWTKTRRFVAVNQWTPVETADGHFVTDPFIDVSVGGLEVPGGQREQLAVWTVTMDGRVFFRDDVRRLAPEGSGWRPIDVPDRHQVTQISCGSSGLVWAVAWNGSALVRTGATRDCLSGRGWLLVEPPTEGSLQQVAVGVDAVWALDRDGRVFFRKGVRGLNAGHNDASATGSGWVEMVQRMSMLSVAANDQLWAVGSDRKTIYLRTGISYGELTGKSWRSVAEGPPTGTFSQTNYQNHVRRSVRSLAEDAQSLSSVDSGTSNHDEVFQEDGHHLTSISAACCNVNADAYLQLSSAGSTGSGSMQSCLFQQVEVQDEKDEPWRGKILDLLQERYDREMRDYIKDFGQAIESGTWIKSGTCFVLPFGTKSRSSWFSGHLELERQGVDCQEVRTESGTLAVVYSTSSSPTSPSRSLKAKKLVLNLAEITLVTTDNCEKGPKNRCLVVVTKTDELRLAFRQEAELDDWLATVNLACGDVHGINGSTAAASAVVWSLADNGEVYLGHEVGGSDLNCLFHYHLGGGHFQQLSASRAGICWSLSHDGCLWSYTSGFGGGVYKTATGANRNCHPMTDTISLVCYENQRWNPVMSFAPIGLPTDRYMWSDETGKQELTKDMVRLPSSHWQWATDWHADRSVCEGTDADGWQYAVDFPDMFPWHGDRRFTDYVRRRRWFRKCRFNTSGPWSEVSPTPSLVSMSLFSKEQSSSSDNDEVPVCAWAVSVDGDALCRVGVTSRSPKGQSWEHVPCDQPLVSVGVGDGPEPDGFMMWAVAADGSAFIRHNIRWRSEPTGDFWFHVEPPRKNCPLKLVTVGRSSVWAIDAKKRLWFRAEMVPIFPEGTHWKRVGEGFVMASAGADDQLWGVRLKATGDAVEQVLVRRVGVTEHNRMGTDWESADRRSYFRWLSTVKSRKQKK